MFRTLTLLVLLTLSVISCSKESSEPKQTEDLKKVLTVDDLNNDDFQYKDGNVTIEGLCVHVCSHSGKKMFIAGTDADNRLQIFTGGNLSVFDKKLEGSKVLVTGTLEEEKIDMNYIKEWQSELEKENSENHEACEFEASMKKIDAIKEKVTKSKKGYISKYTMTGIEVKEM